MKKYHENILRPNRMQNPVRENFAKISGIILRLWRLAQRRFHRPQCIFINLGLVGHHARSRTI
jgi:hypothetical protein